MSLQQNLKIFFARILLIETFLLYLLYNLKTNKMMRGELERFVLNERPYLDIETSLLINIKAGIKRALNEIPFVGNPLAISIQKAAYLAEIRGIEDELTLRN